ncbi:toll/interleukin-1 receptor domain-containing protein [Aliarcobacter cryaerophilus]|uniref:toll/interleukin-1 receptor domain-containing protein n=1 Tax=Aliarcobacter cryaerophilus TaxID=28198 RepID=UPI0021B5874C|nr:TIR domain-containing protein [Aliarcobacter cryaerophilus]MCT7406600.1 TIR domain-containing protein [Aliarcobacter cryaerophilus]MCT7504320.1 TIR domain-containing protein [Aliarcobacter cryaerophilus]
MRELELKNYDYDIALSFAGENRDYVEEVAQTLKVYGVRVFYDKFEEHTLWGKNLIDYLQDIYKNKAKYTVMFISEYYAKKAWTTHERKSMQERAYRESEEYILPARFDNTEIPGLYSTVSYIDLNFKTPYEFTKVILQKIDWQTKNRWFGKWEIESSALCYGGTLEITSVYDNSFDFNLTVIHGSHVGDLDGKATILSGNEAQYISDDTYDEDGKCVITFTKFNDVIQVHENLGCRSFRGMRVMYDGDYKLKKDVFYNRVELNDVLLSKIHDELAKKYFEEFLKCICDIHIKDNLDSFDANVITTGVAGMYTIYEAILMYTNTNEVYGAFLHDDGKVYYFTSDIRYKNDKPKTIKKWLEKFDIRDVILINKLGEIIHG